MLTYHFRRRKRWHKKSCLNYKTNFPLLSATIHAVARLGVDYDECAHGWLDGLNRLFMEAKQPSSATFWFMPLFSIRRRATKKILKTFPLATAQMLNGNHGISSSQVNLTLLLIYAKRLMPQWNFFFWLVLLQAFISFIQIEFLFFIMNTFSVLLNWLNWVPVAMCHSCKD